MLDGLFGGIEFLTTLPVGKKDRLMYLVRQTYLFPVVGLFIGLIVGAIAALLAALIPGVPGIVSVLVIISIYILTGINHIDALSDFGDGITAHGSREKKINAMKDTRLGSGGGAFMIINLIALFVVIESFTAVHTDIYWGYHIGAVMVIAEVSAKHSMITVAWLGRPIHQGMGSFIADNTGFKEFLLSLMISIIICTAFMGSSGFFGLVMALFSSFIIIYISNRHFGGINGDCIGTSNEIGRLVALITICLICQGGTGIWMPW